MRKKDLPSLPGSEITDEAVFMNRREILRLGATAAIGAALAGCSADEAEAVAATPEESGLRALQFETPSAPGFRAEDAVSSYDDATSYNNFYEFGTGKRDP